MFRVVQLDPPQAVDVHVHLNGDEPIGGVESFSHLETLSGSRTRAQLGMLELIAEPFCSVAASVQLQTPQSPAPNGDKP